MCLGAGARAANKAAMRRYEYELKVRKRKDVQKKNAYATASINYKWNIDNIHVGLGNSYAAAQTQLNRLKDKAWRRNESAMLKHLKHSAYGKAMAQGRTGKSYERMGVMEAAELGRFYAQTNAALTDANEDFMIGVKSAREKAKAAQRREFANVWAVPTEDVAPPRPVMQNVGQAMFMDALSIGTSIASFWKPNSAGNLTFLGG